MPKIQLTAAFCAAATCKPGSRRTDYWHTGSDPQGLVLEVRPSGGKTFYLRYQDGSGRQRQIKIANHGDATFEEIRKAARRLRSEVVLGGDPLAAKKEKRAVPTYATLAEQHIAHAKTYQRSWWSIDGIIRKHLVPRWGRMRLDEIASQDIAKWLAEKAEEGLAPATVEKIRVTMGKSFALAAEWGLPGADRNPVRSVPRPKFDNRRERFLSAEEASRLLEAAGESSNPQLRPIVHLLLLTGARISELLHAEWRHVDLNRRSWAIPMTKNGKSRRVPLSQAALEVIDGLPRFDGCPYLVPNPETRKPFVTIKHAFRTAAKKARLYDFRVHDCRHSAASFYLAGGTDLYAVGKILGHAQISSTQRYGHLRSEHLMAAVEAGAAQLGGTTDQA